jgi:hypothetical protein
MSKSAAVIDPLVFFDDFPSFGFRCRCRDTRYLVPVLQ